MDYDDGTTRMVTGMVQVRADIVKELLRNSGASGWSFTLTNGRFGLLKNNFIHVLHNPHTTLHSCRVWGLVLSWVAPVGLRAVAPYRGLRRVVHACSGCRHVGRGA